MVQVKAPSYSELIPIFKACPGSKTTFKLDRSRHTPLEVNVPEMTYLLGGSEGLPPGGDVLADLPEHGPAPSDWGHVSLARRLQGVNILLKTELNTMSWKA